MRQTRSRSTAIGRLGASALGSLDITSLILPLLDFDSFVAFRGTCTDTRAATQQACEDLIAVLERAAHLYVSPRFADGLRLASENRHHLSWLLRAPVIAVVGTCLVPLLAMGRP